MGDGAMSYLARRVNLGLRRRLGLRLPAERVMRDTAGLHVLVDPADLVERSVYVQGHYEARTIIVIGRFLRPGDGFVDVGAHVGLHSLRAASVVGPAGWVVAVEPNPTSIERLRRNVELNAFEQIVRIVPFAASDGSGSASLHLSDDLTNSGGASLGGQRVPTPTVPVTRVRLDDVVPSEATSRLRLIKIDVEGHEPEVLLGAGRLLSSRPAIVFECNDRRPAELLLRMGYRLYELPETDEAARTLQFQEVLERSLDEHVRPGQALNLLALHPESDTVRLPPLE